MKFKGFHKYVILTAMVFALTSFSFKANAEDKPLTRDDVVQIIKEYIEENPDELLQSIIEKSRERLKKKQEDSLNQYKDLIFNDPNSPVVGNKKGDVTVVEFVDYNCGFCKKSAEAVGSVLKEDKNVKVIFKELPVLGDMSKEAAKWALAANKQGKYLEFHMALMGNKKPLSTLVLTELAETVGLDTAQIQKDIKSEGVERQIEKDYDLAVKMGLTGTPVFVIGDKLNMGALTATTLKRELAEQRAKLKK